MNRDISISELESIENGYPKRMIRIERRSGELITLSIPHLTNREINRMVREVYPFSRFEEV